MKLVPLVTTLAATAALAPAANAATTPQIVGTPSVSYKVVDGALSIGATLHLNRAFTDATDQHRYSVVAAPTLKHGQKLADELFGGTALGRLGNRSGAWYKAEAVQLKKRTSVKRGARWQVALARGNHIVGLVKTVTLRRAGY
jgi:hypothetical protein